MLVCPIEVSTDSRFEFVVVIRASTASNSSFVRPIVPLITLRYESPLASTSYLLVVPMAVLILLSIEFVSVRSAVMDVRLAWVALAIDLSWVLVAVTDVLMSESFWLLVWSSWYS